MQDMTWAILAILWGSFICLADGLYRLFRDTFVGGLAATALLGGLAYFVFGITLTLLEGQV